MQSWDQYVEKRNHQEQHDALVEGLADYWESRGFIIAGAVGLDKYGPPPALRFVARKPDVYAYGDGKILIGEAETWRGLKDDPHTPEQWKDFHTEVTKSKRTRLVVVVPRSALAYAKGRAAEWGVDVHEWQ